MHHVASDLHLRDQVDSASQRLENLANYTSELEVMYDDLRRFRHDYQNILISLTSALSDQNLTYAQQALRQLTQSSAPIIDQPTSILGDLQNITDLGVKSVVYQKLTAALQQGLAPRLEAPRPIDLTQTLTSFDAIRLIAILLDNAIAAAPAAAQPKVSLSLFENENAQFIVVGNSTKPAQVDLDHLAELEHSVRLGNNHHLGLRNLKIILGHYPNAVNDRQSNDHWFEQKIVLPKQ